MRAILALLFIGSMASAQELKTFRLRVDASSNLRVGIASPAGEPVADVLYLHGFSDRIDNHPLLFKELTDNGMRVIAFDYPSHGKTEASSLGWYSFEDLADLVKAVEKETASKRTLIIMGWSTGGLLATRMAQTNRLMNLTRYPSALVLFAPGVSVRMIPGDWGMVTESTLTSNPDLQRAGPAKPDSPFAKSVFSMRLLFNSIYAQNANMPAWLPVLTFAGGNEADVYANSAKVVDWVKSQRNHNRSMFGIQCESSKHEMDNEVNPIGPTVRKATAAFALGVINKDPSLKFLELGQGTGCAGF